MALKEGGGRELEYNVSVLAKVFGCINVGFRVQRESALRGSSLPEMQASLLCGIRRHGSGNQRMISQISAVLSKLARYKAVVGPLSP
ncbi:hypothetical protein ACRE_035870 [Hapsidospora chrysogenum ATCC 11550]|uniref:Uncharacterized protein n=1 Tax=Hapsidospora chrysogenum (strain ATCC 11550 / CBS 779.69 / DSM 880 / IAM 14645 / JCM 23072 / IMI 49137) TaxID=857340 RepID=A0A086T8B9_HAPC1|nr:hypothetical protein ACRE_035870 [Hapsidospora chrysogenum ATCC 11550]